jgi:hypothetical protein
VGSCFCKINIDDIVVSLQKFGQKNRKHCASIAMHLKNVNFKLTPASMKGLITKISVIMQLFICIKHGQRKISADDRCEWSAIVKRAFVICDAFF